MSIGFRPKGEAGPAYHPDRDYAYVTPTLMAAAVASMETADLPAVVQNWKTENQITSEEIGAAAEALARAQRDFVNAADPVSSLEQALTRHGFLDIRYPVQQFLFASIGQAFCAAWFVAVREVSRINEESPAAPGMTDFMATVRGFYGYKQSPSSRDMLIAQLQLKNDVLQSRLNTLYTEHLLLQKKLAELQKPVTPDEPAPSPAPVSVTAKVLGVAQLLFSYIFRKYV